MDSNEEYSNNFLKIFTEAVNCRLRSHYPIGSLLSGGLDSSSILCTANKLLSEKADAEQIKTFSAIFNNTPECDEQYYINKVIEMGKISPYFIRADLLSPLIDKEKVLWHLEEPYFTVNFYFHWQIHQTAEEKRR